MRYFVLAVLSVAAVLSLTADAPADCRVVRQRVVNHAAAVVVKEAVVATFAAVPVVVPAYSVGYSPEGAELQALRRELAELKGLLKGQAEPLPPPTPAQNAQAQAVSILQARCAKCHTGTTAKGGLRIFDAPGQPNASLTALDVAAIAAAVKDGTMPPAPEKPLDDPEYLAVEVWSKAVVQAARKSSLKK